MTATVDNAVANLQRAKDELQRRLDEALAERDEALDQQTATAEVLGVINSSPGNLAPVFAAMLEKAMRLCEAAFGILMTYDGESFRATAQRGLPSQFADYIAGNPTGWRGAHLRLAEGASLVHLLDAKDDEAYPSLPSRRALVDLGGARTLVLVPLRQDERLLGSFAIYRQEVRAFSDKQIALLQNFAAQAVIAMENARLITETREALDQQTATAEVLGVINSSPGNLAPVFDAMLEKAHALCGVEYGTLVSYDGEYFHMVANQGMPDSFVEQMRQPFRASPGGGHDRLVRGERFVHVPDVRAMATHPIARASIEAGSRTILMVPLRKDGVLLGLISAVRREVRPFSDKEIALLENFAAQAVIAMENARLITETQEALDQQTATAEVLQVINSSPGNLAPVFEAMVERAMRLCEATVGALAIFEDGHYRSLATRGIPPELTGFVTQSLAVGPGSVADRLMRGEEIIHLSDITVVSSELRSPGLIAMIELGNARTALWIGLHKDGVTQGFLVFYRDEVRPFSDKQIALSQNFAAQAVIAMENARLITETREALDQQTATAEVLGVINASPGDLAPVFDAILDKAHALCGATRGTLFLFDGDLFRAAAVHGYPEELAEQLRQGGSASPTSVFASLFTGARLVHNPDLREIDNPLARAVAERGGVRTNLLLPLRKDDVLLGVISCNRQEVRPFTDKQIALLENFAAQAVIAMENARLITETREALDQQTAAAEVLQVINSSPGDLQPVFDIMLDKAMQLCGAAFGMMMVTDGKQFPTVVASGVPPAFAEFRRHNPVSIEEGPVFARLMGGEAFVHSIDLKDDEAYRRGIPQRLALVDLGGARTSLVVALRKDDAVLGLLQIYRQEVRPFSDKQVALLQNFAAQAVIAMENARLFDELCARTGDLQESLEYQTATSDVLKVISRSTFDLQPVLDTLVQTAARLCSADNGSIATRDGEVYRVVANFALAPEWNALVRTLSFRPGRDSVTGRTLLERQVIQIADITADPEYTLTGAATVGNMRTVLGVPLLREGAPIGVMQLSRTKVEPFSERQIELVRTFADQAVIAIENARLITETREALEQQTATAEVLEVINSSPGDLAPVFDAMLEKAMRLCEASIGAFYSFDGEFLDKVAHRGNISAEHIMQTQHVRAEPGGNFFRLIQGETIVHVADLKETEMYRSGFHRAVDMVDIAGARTAVWVGLRRDETLLGILVIYRQEVRPFTDKQIALLQNFAAQAVIAMENARLITETREALDQQTATAEVLGVINASPGDLTPVFDVILEKAHTLCGVDHGSLQLYDSELYRAVAIHGAVLSVAEQLRRPRRPDPNHPIHRLFAGEPFAHVPDLAEIDTPGARNMVKLAGLRTVLYVALRKEESLLGFIGVGRKEVRPFTDKEIALLQNFAAQAVIAIENARLLTATREARDDAEAALGDLKAAQANLIQAEKMASLGQLTAGIAHEIKNPLNFVNNFASLSVELLEELKEATEPAVAALDDAQRAAVGETIDLLSGNLEKITEHGKRADNIVKSMLEHSRGVTGERREVDLNGLIDEALNLAYHGARAQDQTFNILLERDFAAGVAPIELAPQDVTRVLLNLFGNGFYAATKHRKEAGDATFFPTLKVTTRDLGDGIEISVRDNGTGIAPEIKDKLFQPFFTTKPTGEGTGLGLSISYDVVTQQHGGTITVDSEVGAFTEFTIRLPRTQPAAVRREDA